MSERERGGWWKVGHQFGDSRSRGLVSLSMMWAKRGLCSAHALFGQYLDHMIQGRIRRPLVNT